LEENRVSYGKFRKLSFDELGARSGFFIGSRNKSKKANKSAQQPFYPITALQQRLKWKSFRFFSERL
jgi:hypothetical protein